jgi:hypothetical protein
VRLIIQIQRIGNQLLDIHVGRTFAAPVAGRSAAPAIAIATWTAPVASRASTTISSRAAILATRATAARTTGSPFARWTVATFALLGFLFFCFRHCSILFS